MWAKEKPQDPEPKKGDDVQAIAFEKGSIHAWMPNGRTDARSITYDSSVSVPYIVHHKEWVIDVNASNLGILIIPIPFLLFMYFILRKDKYELNSWNELVVCDPDQLREYSFVGIRQNLPALVAAAL